MISSSYSQSRLDKYSVNRNNENLYNQLSTREVAIGSFDIANCAVVASKRQKQKKQKNMHPQKY